jgi:electron transport complex protein RnfE
VAIDDDKKNISDKEYSSLLSEPEVITSKSDLIMQNKEESQIKTTISKKEDVDATIENKDVKTEKKIEDLSIKSELIKNELPEVVTLPKEETISKKDMSTVFSKDEAATVSKKIETVMQNVELQEKKTEILQEKSKNTNVDKENIFDTERVESDVAVNVEEEGNNIKDFLSAMFSNNPVFVLLLGLGPALAVTTKLTNGIGLGIIVLLTTLLSNVVVSALKGFIPAKIRLPFYLTVTGSFVSIIIVFVKAFLPDLGTSLGIFLPLTAVNSVILERVEIFACKKKITNTILNSLGTGIGFMLFLILISFIREFFGTLQLDFSDFGLGVYGFEKISILGIPIYEQAKMFVMPAGAFLTLGLLLAVKQAIHNYSNKNIED